VATACIRLIFPITGYSPGFDRHHLADGIFQVNRDLGIADVARGQPPGQLLLDLERGVPGRLERPGQRKRRAAAGVDLDDPILELLDPEHADLELVERADEVRAVLGALVDPGRGRQRGLADHGQRRRAAQRRGLAAAAEQRQRRK